MNLKRIEGNMSSTKITCPRCSSGHDCIIVTYRTRERYSILEQQDLEFLQDMALEELIESYDIEFVQIECTNCNTYWYNTEDFVKELKNDSTLQY